MREKLRSRCRDGACDCVLWIRRRVRGRRSRSSACSRPAKRRDRAGGEVTMFGSQRLSGSRPRTSISGPALAVREDARRRSTGAELAVVYSICFLCSCPGAHLRQRRPAPLRSGGRRGNDLVIRTALGATRGRIVLQLFTGRSCSVVSRAGRPDDGRCRAPQSGACISWDQSRPPAVLDQLGVSPATVLFTVALVFGAAVAGVMPALKITQAWATA